MNQHTPGPWKIVWNTDHLYEPDADDLAHKYIESIDDANGGTVCYTESGYFKMHPGNAVLIAAAPRLLSEAKLLGGGDVYFDEYGRYCFCAMHGKGKPEQHATSCNEMNNAIAQAEGKV
jgi:hypothetical protein